MSIRISIVGYNKTFRDFLIPLIHDTEEFELQAEYDNGEQAEAILDKKPDIVIIDLLLPGMTGIELIRRIVARDDGIQFLICSSCYDDEQIFTAMESGARGYILKEYNKTHITEAIKELYSGGSPMSPIIGRRVFNFFRKKQNELGNVLSDREKEILKFASTGMMYWKIGEKLEITHETVKRHMKNICIKLKVQNKTEAINKYNSRYISL